MNFLKKLLTRKKDEAELMAQFLKEYSRLVKKYGYYFVGAFEVYENKNLVVEPEKREAIVKKINSFLNARNWGLRPVAIIDKFQENANSATSQSS